MADCYFHGSFNSSSCSHCNNTPSTGSSVMTRIANSIGPGPWKFDHYSCSNKRGDFIFIIANRKLLVREKGKEPYILIY
jgi:hypothetical protein